jgi:hypothetical protein
MKQIFSSCKFIPICIATVTILLNMLLQIITIFVKLSNTNIIDDNLTNYIRLYSIIELIGMYITLKYLLRIIHQNYYGQNTHNEYDMIYHNPCYNNNDTSIDKYETEELFTNNNGQNVFLDNEYDTNKLTMESIIQNNEKMISNCMTLLERKEKEIYDNTYHINILEQKNKKYKTNKKLNILHYNFLTNIGLCFLMQIFIANLFGIHDIQYEHNMLIQYTYKIFTINILNCIMI